MTSARLDSVSSIATFRLAIYVVILTLTYMLWQVFYAFFISPVRQVPGPFWSKITSIPYRWATFKARRSAYAHDLIKQYGPIVVIAPDQIHTSDDVAMKTIYDRSAIKTSFYRNMGSWKGVVTTLGKLDYTSAAPTRANLIQCFQNRNLDLLTSHIDFHVLKFVKIMKREGRASNNIDGVVWFRLLALDIVTDVLWGEDTNLLGQAGGDTPAFLRRFFAFSKYNALKSFIPVLEPIARYIGPPKWSRLRKDCLDMDVTARDALARWKNQDIKVHDRDVLSMLSNMNTLEVPENRVDEEDLPAYMVEMMAAGSSTTSHTAAFACWALTNHPEAQTRLRRELADLFPDSNAVDMRALQSSEYLDAVIRETMRLWPMIPGPLERVLGKEIQVGSLKIPRGVIASTSAFTSGRNANVYDSPEEWRPERWLNATDRMRLNWTPFGYGARICPGSNLAMTELKYMIGAIYRNMQSVQPEGITWEPLELSDVFAAGSKSGHCWLRFVADETDSKMEG